MKALEMANNWQVGQDIPPGMMISLKGSNSRDMRVMQALPTTDMPFVKWEMRQQREGSTSIGTVLKRVYCSDEMT
jgi:hypothetical protein